MFGLNVIKRFNYRGNANEEYSNLYWFNGAAPASSAGWRTAFDALVAAEKTLYPAQVAVIRGYGYTSGAVNAQGKFEPDDAVWSVDLRVSPDAPVAGTFPNSAGIRLGGDSAVWVRWKTDRMVKGKPVYLRKYFHPACGDSANTDNVLAAWATPAGTFGTSLRTGSIAVLGNIINPKHPADAILSNGQSSVTTVRTLKRRGKRPPTGP